MILVYKLLLGIQAGYFKESITISNLRGLKCNSIRMIPNPTKRQKNSVRKCIFGYIAFHNECADSTKLAPRIDFLPPVCTARIIRTSICTLKYSMVVCSLTIIKDE